MYRKEKVLPLFTLVQPFFGHFLRVVTFIQQCSNNIHANVNANCLILERNLMFASRQRCCWSMPKLRRHFLFCVSPTLDVLCHKIKVRETTVLLVECPSPLLSVCPNTPREGGLTQASRHSGRNSMSEPLPKSKVPCVIA